MDWWILCIGWWLCNLNGWMEWMNAWMTGWMNEQMTGYMHEWMKEWMSCNVQNKNKTKQQQKCYSIFLYRSHFLSSWNPPLHYQNRDAFEKRSAIQLFLEREKKKGGCLTIFCLENCYFISLLLFFYPDVCWTGLEIGPPMPSSKLVESLPTRWIWTSQM